MESIGKPQGLIVTGTDTGVGKTSVAAALVRLWRGRGVRVGAIKPVATGGEWRDGRFENSDGRMLLDALEAGVPYHRVVPLQFEAPLAPVVAARLEGLLLTRELLEQHLSECLNWWTARADALIIEGVGGFLCPVARDATFADLAVTLGYPVLLVARAGLGTLSHTLLSIEAIHTRGLRVAGVVLNQTLPLDDASVASNPGELARRVEGVGPIISLCYNHGHQQTAWAPAALERLDRFAANNASPSRP
jgi:dethiobiotin synthetase